MRPIIATFLLAALCGAACAADRDGFPLVLSSSLESDRPALTRWFSQGQRIARVFALAQRWDRCLATPLIRKAVVVDSREEFARFVRELHGMPPTAPVPRNYSAMLKDGVFVAVSPAIFAENDPKMQEPAAFSKLIAHEQLHEIHRRLLYGNDEAMGAIWVFEGFATFASGQYASSTLSLTPEQIASVLANPDRQDYEKYRFVFAHFAHRRTVEAVLLAAARRADFLALLQAP